MTAVLAASVAALGVIALSFFVLANRASRAAQQEAAQAPGRGAEARTAPWPPPLRGLGRAPSARAPARGRAARLPAGWPEPRERVARSASLASRGPTRPPRRRSGAPTAPASPSRSPARRSGTPAARARPSSSAATRAGPGCGVIISGSSTRAWIGPRGSGTPTASALIVLRAEGRDAGAAAWSPDGRHRPSPGPMTWTASIWNADGTGEPPDPPRSRGRRTPRSSAPTAPRWMPASSSGRWVERRRVRAVGACSAVMRTRSARRGSA